MIRGLALSRSGSPDLPADFGRRYGKNPRKQASSHIAVRPGSREEAATFRKLFAGESHMCPIGGTTMYFGVPSTAPAGS